jgi:hypothetical protein
LGKTAYFITRSLCRFFVFLFLLLEEGAKTALAHANRAKTSPAFSRAKKLSASRDAAVDAAYYFLAGFLAGFLAAGFLAGFLAAVFFAGFLAAVFLAGFLAAVFFLVTGFFAMPPLLSIGFFYQFSPKTCFSLPGKKIVGDE